MGMSFYECEDVPSIVAASEDFLKEVEDAKNRKDDLDLILLGSGAVDCLGQLASHAKMAADDKIYSEKYQEIAQRLIDFCEEQKHPNHLKEYDAISCINYYFELRIPAAFPPTIIRKSNEPRP